MPRGVWDFLLCTITKAYIQHTFKTTSLLFWSITSQVCILNMGSLAAQFSVTLEMTKVLNICPLAF